MFPSHDPAHPSYVKYLHDWLLCERSLYGGVEYRDGEYLKAYSNDIGTASEVINTTLNLSNIKDWGMADTLFYWCTLIYGSYRYVVQSFASRANSRQDADAGDGYNSNFYQEKLNNVPVFPYTRLYTSEYNAILFRSPPQRTLPDTPEVEAFKKDADGQGNSLNEFMSMVDTYTTVFGVVWVSCMKPAGSSYAKWRMHKPTRS